jgi:hypothetical protein
MNSESTQTHFLAGHHVSKSPVRGVFNPRRRTPRTTRTEPATIRATSSDRQPEAVRVGGRATTTTAVVRGRADRSRYRRTSADGLSHS